MEIGVGSTKPNPIPLRIWRLFFPHSPIQFPKNYLKLTSFRMEPHDPMGPQTHGGFYNFLLFGAQCIQLIQIISIGSKDCFFHNKISVNNRFWCPLAWIYHFKPPPLFCLKNIASLLHYCMVTRNFERRWFNYEILFSSGGTFSLPSWQSWEYGMTKMQ